MAKPLSRLLDRANPKFFLNGGHKNKFVFRRPVPVGEEGGISRKNPRDLGYNLQKNLY